MSDRVLMFSPCNLGLADVLVTKPIRGWAGRLACPPVRVDLLLGVPPSSDYLHEIAKRGRSLE